MTYVLMLCSDSSVPAEVMDEAVMAGCAGWTEEMARREVDDLAALIDAAGGAACVYGVSSGAVLALRAAAEGLAIDRLALRASARVVADALANATYRNLPGRFHDVPAEDLAPVLADFFGGAYR